ncbi:MAG TPA: helix-turn-helix transcriptional regulator [Polyangiaceae bacterium]
MSRPSLQDIVAENVRLYAQERSMSLDSLADFAGVSRRQLYNLLSGEHDITLGWLAKLADALEVEPALLLTPRK